MTGFRALALVALVALMPGLARANEAGDLVFADRTPWQVKDKPVVWSLDISGPAAQDFRPIADGRVALSEVTDPSDGKPVLQINQESTVITRKIGPFPTDGGDPTVIFFLENVARDMAAVTGGSPFYIRNRMKDALFRGGEIRAEDGRQIAVFRPFVDDPNKARMAGFDQLELAFTIDDPKQPISSMIASTGGDAPLFRVAMVKQ